LANENQPLVVEEEDRGLRLDQFLGKRHQELSRRRARVAIEIGAVFVDRKRVKVAGRKVWPGQQVEVHLGGAFERATKKTGRRARDRDRAALPNPVVRYHDDSIVVLDKPSGLLSAPTPESDLGNCVDWLVAEGLGPVHVVHRLDLLTSGLLVFARSEEANRRLSAAFRDHSIDREYEVVVFGNVAELDGVGAELSVDYPVGEKHAVTHFKLLAQSSIACEASMAGECLAEGASGESSAESVEEGGDEDGHKDSGGQFLIPVSLLEARLETGRQHQIRIHAQHLGLAVVRDPLYGDRERERALGRRSAPRLALHAKRLGLTSVFPEVVVSEDPRPQDGSQPDSTRPLDFISAWPRRMQRWLVEVGLVEKAQGPPPSQTSI
jgi:23S rRNA pseudouridine1911/1915/1917 synthase